MIKLLIVDDNRAVRQFLRIILELAGDIEVIGEAANGLEAIKFVSEKTPDIITMDVYMPEMDGFEATRKILEIHPVPIIILSSNITPNDVELCFEALEAGAVAAMKTPGANDEDLKMNLVDTIRAMANTRIKARPFRQTAKKYTSQVAQKELREILPVVAIGASTGGPQILHQIISNLPADFAFPIAVVQHMSEGFIDGLTEWLKAAAQLNISTAQHGMQMAAGNVYIAPAGRQMGILPGGKIALFEPRESDTAAPSISYTFRSLLENCSPYIVGMLLSGMGSDGSTELMEMTSRGAITIAQSPETCTVYGLCKEPIESAKVNYILPPSKIAMHLVHLAAMFKENPSIFG